MQLTFGAVRDPSASEAWSRVLDVLRDAIAVITPKELAFRLDIQPSYLSDALRGHDRKGIKAEWIPTILAMAPDANRMAIVGELAAMCGLEVIRRKDLTPEERLARLEQRVAAELGPAGQRIIEENRR